MDGVLKEVKGINGQLELLETKIRIKRKGFVSLLTQGLKGDKEILLKQISSIQFRKASVFTNGYIQFSFLGGLETKRGLFDAVNDENTIMFNKRQMTGFEEIKSTIESKIDEIENKKAMEHSINDLEKLAELREKGIISEEEFEAKKKQILGL
jgi:hypothetical protein